MFYAITDAEGMVDVQKYPRGIQAIIHCVNFLDANCPGEDRKGNPLCWQPKPTKEQGVVWAAGYVKNKWGTVATVERLGMYDLLADC